MTWWNFLKNLRWPRRVPLDIVVYEASEMRPNDYLVVEDALGGISGVHCPQVDALAKTINVAFDPAVADEQAIRKALEEAGFSVNTVKIEYQKPKSE